MQVCYLPVFITYLYYFNDTGSDTLQVIIDNVLLIPHILVRMNKLGRYTQHECWKDRAGIQSEFI